MSYLQKFTTEYIATEDRIRLSGQVEGEAPLVIWLTQRLLLRLIPVLTEWLDQKSPQGMSGEIMHSFAQQAARTSLPPQEPVVAKETGAFWLASSVDIARSEQSVKLTFRDSEDRSTALTLNGTQLRQWLSILHDLYVKAAWPKDIWPEWMQTNTKPQSPNMIQ